MPALTPDRWAQLEELFHQAQSLRPPEQRALVAGVEDDDLRQRLEKMLQAANQTSILDDSVAEAAGMQWQSANESLADLRFGPFELRRELGRGGMGAVYLAQRVDGQFDQQVAVKVMQAGPFAARLESRFQQEGRILAALEHPNIARLLDGGLSPSGLPYLVMEFVDGLPLGEYLDRHQPSLTARLQLFTGICRAVEYAHQHLVIHRDLKPDNILVTAEGQPKLLDFGIAKLLDPEGQATVTEFQMLTPRYASPEQILNHPVSTSTDVYALGVILFEMLTGQLPYPADTVNSPLLFAAITERDPLQASAVNAALAKQLRGDLDTVLRKALKKLPAERYGSVDRLRQDIENYLQGLPVTAQPDTLGYRVSKFVARHKWGVAATAATVLLLAGSAVVTALQAKRANDERVKAEQVSSFLKELLQNANPVSREKFAEKGKDLLVVDLLDASSDGLDQRLKDQPEAIVSLRRTLSSAYLSLSTLDKAEREARLGLERAKQRYGPESAEAAELQMTLANVWLAEDHHQRAAEDYEKAAAILRKTSPGSPLLAEALGNLAAITRRRGDRPRSLQLYDESLAILRATSPGSARLAESLTLKGVTAHEAGNLKMARDLYTEALQIYRRLPVPPTKMASTLQNLAAVNWDEDHVQEAVAQMQEATALYEKRLGPDHPYLAQTYQALSTYFGSDYEGNPVHDAAKGIDYGRRSVALLEKAYSDDHLTVAMARYNLGTILCRDPSHSEEGEALLRRAQQIALAKAALDSNEVSASTLDLGRCLARRGKYQESLPYLAQSYQLNLKRMGSQDWWTQSALRQFRSASEKLGVKLTEDEARRKMQQMYPVQ